MGPDGDASEADPGWYRAAVIVGMTKLLGILAGISAGMSILLSVAGFLVLRAHANLLGIAAVHHHSIEDYLYEGGYFLITTTFSLIEGLATTPYGWLTLGLAALMLIARNVAAVSRWCNAKVRKPWVSVVAMMPALVLVLVCFWTLAPPESARDLLFSSGNELEIGKRATHEGLMTLTAEYKEGSTLFLLAIVAAALGRVMSRTNSFSNDALRFVLYGLLLVAVVLLPINYGLKVYPSNYHKVTGIETADKPQIPESQRIWLLSENDHEFLLYLGDIRRIVLLERAQVRKITLGARLNVFMDR